MKKFICCFLLIFIIIIKPADSQEKTNRLGFINPDQKSMTLPFIFINNLIIIPLQINTSDSLHFILDSGVRSAIISELADKDSLVLAYVKQLKINGLGKGEPLDALYSTGNAFRIRNIIGTNQNIFILLENIFNLSTKLGKRVNGLIGYDVFKDFIVEINYSKQEIEFYNPATYTYSKSRSTVTLPLEIIEQKPYIQAEIVNNDSSVISVKLLVDTGGSMGLWLAPSSNNAIKVPAQNLEMFLGVGLNGDISGKIGRMQKLRIGKFELKNPLVSFPDSQSVGNVIKTDKRNGSLGSEVLRRFKIVIDYTNKKISFTPNRNFTDPFTFNISGIEIQTPMPGLPIYEISDIRKGSPADIAGFKKGDQLFKINYSHAFEYTIDDIFLFLHGQKGKKMTITVLRQGLEYKARLLLDDPLKQIKSAH